MKKFILGLTVGLIIAGSIGVYAAIKIQADEIGYKDGTVASSLNDLYDIANQDLIDKMDGTISYDATHGSKTMGANTSLSLDAGNYIIIGISEYLSVMNAYAAGSQGITTTSAIGISTTAGSCEQLSSKFTRAVPTQAFLSTGKYLRNYMFMFTWKCKLPSSGTVTVTESSIGASDASNHGAISMQAIRID